MNQAKGGLPSDLLRTLAANAGKSDAARQLARESVQAMREAGLWRLLVPKRAGGEARDFAEAAALITACSRHCSAAGGDPRHCQRLGCETCRNAGHAGGCVARRAIGKLGQGG
ncbi:MAG: acyl-CoA dehydrogenase family protein [Alphaproteobacteria bacterium]|nr:acyl-CoA dehydrogenase family protein [Alphaproteobacteria bacterium]